jgi:hypothetical protein
MPLSEEKRAFLLINLIGHTQTRQPRLSPPQVDDIAGVGRKDAKLDYND